MKWKPPANPLNIKGNRRHRQLTRHKQRQQNDTVYNPFDVFGFGWDHDTPSLYEDESTLKYIHDDEDILNNSDVVDLRNTADFPGVYNQLKLGSCTANALAFCYQFDMLKEKISFGPNKSPIPSRLFIYYYERKSENTINFDKGATLADGITKVLDVVGVCSEDDWLYDVTKFNVEPSKDAIENAKNHKAIKETSDKEFTAIHNTVNNIKNNLKLGYPVAFGLRLYESFSKISKSNPKMPIPEKNEKFRGGHALVIVGFKEQEQVFIVRNSWGSYWGDNGYFYMPYSIIDAVDESNNKKYSTDFWSILKVT